MTLCSLNSVQQEVQDQSDHLEAQVLATTAHNKVLLTTWEAVKTAGISDPQYSTLLHAVQSSHDTWPNTVADFKRYKDDLSTVDGVVTYKGRVLVPQVLQPQVLQSLHQAHQGASTMVLRTQESVWWPSIAKDLEKFVHHA